MMQWTPFGTTEADLKEHVRTFASVFEHVTVVRGPGGYGFYMLGSDQPIDLPPERIREVLERPGILDDISSAFDSPRRQSTNGWPSSKVNSGWPTTPSAAMPETDHSSPTTSHGRNTSSFAA